MLQNSQMKGRLGITVDDNPDNQSLIDFQISDSGIGMTSRTSR